MANQQQQLQKLLGKSMKPAVAKSHAKAASKMLKNRQLDHMRAKRQQGKSKT